MCLVFTGPLRFLDHRLIEILIKYRSVKSKKLGDIAKVQRGTLPPRPEETFLEKTNKRMPWFNHQVHRYQIEYSSEQTFVDPKKLREGKPKELFWAEKIFGRQLISRQFRMQFAYCNKCFAFKKNLYAIYKLDNSICDYSFLLAILNSKFYSYVQVGLNASGQRDDYPSFSLQDYRNFLIPEISKSKQKAFVDLVDRILAEKKKNPKANTSELEDKIDKMVYKLYDLNPEEIDIVNKSTK